MGHHILVPELMYASVHIRVGIITQEATQGSEASCSPRPTGPLRTD